MLRSVAFLWCGPIRMRPSRWKIDEWTDQWPNLAIVFLSFLSCFLSFFLLSSFFVSENNCSELNLIKTKPVFDVDVEMIESMTDTNSNCLLGGGSKGQEKVDHLENGTGNEQPKPHCHIVHNK